MFTPKTGKEPTANVSITKKKHKTQSLYFSQFGTGALIQMKPLRLFLT